MESASRIGEWREKVILAKERSKSRNSRGKLSKNLRETIDGEIIERN